MKIFRRLKFLTVILALLVTAGSVVAAVQASDMNAKMAMATAMDDTSNGACSACPGDADNSGTVNCLPLCHLGHAAILLNTIAANTPPADTVVPVRAVHPHVVSSGIDPHPPKPSA